LRADDAERKRKTAIIQLGGERGGKHGGSLEVRNQLLETGKSPPMVKR